MAHLPSPSQRTAVRSVGAFVRARTWCRPVFELAVFELAVEMVALLVLAAFVAGFVDAIAGGGGLIGIPVLLLAGASPLQALATNKLQGSFGSGAAALIYARAGQVRIGRQRRPAALALVFGAMGAVAARLVPVEALRIAMPVALIAVAGFFALKPGLGDRQSIPRMRPPVFEATLVPLIAFYDGIFGPGTGSFLMLALVMLAGQGLLQATAQTKVLNFASNLGALAVLAMSGQVWWATGIAMGLAQMAGAWFGARMALRKGARLIKPLIVSMSCAMALRLLWQVWA